MLRSHKTLSIVMTLCLCLALLAPVFVMAPVAEAVSISANNTPTVSRPATTATLGTIIMDFNVLNPSPAAASHRAVIKLPTSYRFLSAADAAVAAATNVTAQRFNDISGTNTAGVVFNTTAGYTVTLTQLSDNQIQMDIVNPAIVQNVKFAILLGNVNIPSSAEDTINANIIKLNGDFSDAIVAVAKTSAGGAVDVLRTDPPTVSANTVAVVMNSTTGATTFQIHVREDVLGALQQGTTTLKFKLPKGVTWVGAPFAVAQFPGNVALPAAEVMTATAADNSVLVISRATTGGTAAIASKYTFTVANAAIAIDPDQAAFGDIVATVSGTSTSNMSEVKLCSYQDFGYSVTASTPDTKVIAGKSGEIVSNIVLKEKQAGSLLEGRTITMTLPDGVYWKDYAAGAIFNGTKSAGGLLFNFNQSASDPAKLTATVTVTGAATQTTSKGELNFEKFEVDVAPDFTGPIEVQFSGTAGVNDKIKIGEAIAPISATSETKNVIIGVQKQAAGSIVIAEGKAGDIKSRTEAMTIAGPAAALANAVAGATMTNLVLSAPYGVTWNKVPTVKVTEGDISLGTATIGWAAGGARLHELTIPVKSTSSKPSKVEISGIVYDLDRTVPEGELKISIGGTAVAETAAGWDAWANRDSSASVVAANVITPAPDEGTTGAAVGQFKISSNIYQVNGVSKVMDAAPYIKNGRTYVPVRFMGYAMGLTDADIVWDEATQKATLTMGDNSVELTIGSTTIVVNGESKTMDVAPEISAEGRTMLPARFVAEGLGFQVGWDQATGTVLISK